MNQDIKHKAANPNPNPNTNHKRSKPYSSNANHQFDC